MEPGRVYIKYMWVFDIKRDGTFRARLVASGYSQVPGVDFQELYSPVINNVVFWILIMWQII
jgi:Reverse transcriptase (RNA-dependent DNA polymerase)